MFTGNSGSKTVRITSMIRGLSASVLAASGTMLAVSFVDAGGSGTGSGIIGSGFMLLRRHVRLAIERRLQRVPGEARALHADRELADAREHRQLAQVLDR